MSKIGDILIRMHRTFKGKIKQVTVKRYASGKWFAMLTTEYDAPKTKKHLHRKAGIDVGILNYAYDSVGNHTAHLHPLNAKLKRLQKEQQRLSRKGKRSQNRKKQKITVARVHEKIVNQRDDFLHKLSHYYASQYDLIAAENLNVRGLIALSHNARNIMDASWNRFTQMLSYKAESAGGRFVKVNPRNTTQECSKCGRTTDKELWHRTHRCQYCGLEIDRDYNSALNILQRALRQELSEFTPVETEPLLLREQVQSQKQEAISSNPSGCR